MVCIPTPAAIWLKTYPLTLDELRIIQQNSKKVIKFTDDNGVAFYGYISEIDVDVVANGKSKSTFKLLRAR